MIYLKACVISALIVAAFLSVLALTSIFIEWSIPDWWSREMLFDAGFLRLVALIWGGWSLLIFLSMQRPRR